MHLVLSSINSSFRTTAKNNAKTVSSDRDDASTRTTGTTRVLTLVAGQYDSYVDDMTHKHDSNSSGLEAVVVSFPRRL